MNKLTLFSILIFYLACVTALKVNLCVYTLEDDICSSSSLCQEFSLGVCTEYTDCNSTDICSVVIVKLNENEYTLINYYTECQQNDIALQVNMTLGVCEVHQVGNFSYRSVLHKINKPSNGIPDYAVFLIIVGTTLLLAGVWYGSKHLCKKSENSDKSLDFQLNEKGEIVTV